MRNIQSYFAEYLGKPILYKDKELPLIGIGLKTLSLYNGTTAHITANVEDCKIIADSKEEVIEKAMPTAIAIVRTGDENNILVSAVTLIGPSKIERFKEIETQLINLSGLSKEDYYGKRTRKREVVWCRQIHMTIFRRIMKYSFARSAAIFGRDHATAISSGKKIDDTYLEDREWREVFNDVFVTLVRKYGKEGARAFNGLTWIKYE
nr:helix-turn-helix domain-containing protein [uncultured Draconibacterium sp.]